MSTDYTKATTTRATAVPRDELDIAHPPRGITMEREHDGTTVINVRLFTPAAFGCLLFTLIWNGFAWIFFSNTIRETAAKFGFQIKNPTIVPSNVDAPLWFALIVFAAGLFVALLTIYVFLGKIVIRVGAQEGSVFSGIGPLGRTQRFAPQSVKFVDREIIIGSNETPNDYYLFITMHDGRKIGLLSLGAKRETWLAFALNKILGTNAPTANACESNIAANHASPVPLDALDFDHPPRGIKMERTPDGGVVIRSRIFNGAAVFLIIFTVFWNGIASIFVCDALGKTAQKYGWDISLPNMKTSGTDMSLGGYWLFLTPFILIGIVTALLAIRGVFGKCVIAVSHNEASVFTGVGVLGKTQRFNPQSVKRLGRYHAYSQNKQPVYNLLIEMHNGRGVKLPGFGTVREAWLAFALKKIFGLNL